MPFLNFSDLKSRKLAEGVDLKAVSGEKMTLTRFELARGAAIPEHAHPHEQVGTILQGSVELVVGGESRAVTPGDLWVIPANVPHSGRCLEGPAELIEVFSPVREDYA